ncbi:MAG: ribbon-helix-helix protein, CopG family [Heliobacteriaceae bacterium]|nr:ribbon-helix-helix protein, CopG family [Heliobacteriaceae bacterium]
MASEQFSLRIPQNTKSKLEELAKATGRSKSYLAVEAIDKYLEHEAWMIRAVQEGLKAADNGELVPLEEVKSYWENR